MPVPKIDLQNIYFAKHTNSQRVVIRPPEPCSHTAVRMGKSDEGERRMKATLSWVPDWPENSQ